MKTRKTPKESLKEGCPECGNVLVCYYNYGWRFDCDDGLVGVKINYCPFCGLDLEEDVDTEPLDNPKTRTVTLEKSGKDKENIWERLTKW